MRKILIIIIFTITSYSLFAQNNNTDKGYISLGWSPAWGLGHFGDFVSDGSYRGFFLNGKGFISENIALGGSFGWSGFYDVKDRATLNFDEVNSINADGAVTGNLTNYYYNIPILVDVSYYPTINSFIKPYVSFGVGTVYSRLESYIGLVGVYNETWQFQMAPELGTFIPFGKDANIGAHIAARYNYITFQDYRFSGISYFQLNIGISWKL